MTLSLSLANEHGRLAHWAFMLRVQGPLKKAVEEDEGEDAWESWCGCRVNEAPLSREPFCGFPEVPVFTPPPTQYPLCPSTPKYVNLLKFVFPLPIRQKPECSFSTFLNLEFSFFFYLNVMRPSVCPPAPSLAHYFASVKSLKCQADSKEHSTR